MLVLTACDTPKGNISAWCLSHHDIAELTRPPKLSIFRICLLCSLVTQAAPAAVDAAAAAAGDQDSELLSPAEYRRKYSMWVHPPEAPGPLQTFSQAQLPQGLLKAVSHSSLCVFSLLLLVL